MGGSLAVASQSACPEQYAAGRPPMIASEQLSAATRELCSSSYAVLHSGVTRTPLYAGEHLTRERILQTKGVERKGRFHTDNRLPPDERAEVSDYTGSGYDRGHVAPSGDMPDIQSQHESFALSNVIPQVPSVNRGIWSRVESLVRKMVMERGELFVVTGPLFNGGAQKRCGGRVLIPPAMYKAVYDPIRDEAAAFLVDNIPGANFRIVSIDEVNRIVGFDLFPGISERAKSSTELLLFRSLR